MKNNYWYLYTQDINYNSAYLSMQKITEEVRSNLSGGTIKDYCKNILIANSNPLLINTIMHILNQLSPDDAEWFEKMVALS
jgi:hypothetical protein